MVRPGAALSTQRDARGGAAMRATADGAHSNSATREHGFWGCHTPAIGCLHYLPFRFRRLFRNLFTCSPQKAPVIVAIKATQIAPSHFTAIPSLVRDTHKKYVRDIAIVNPTVIPAMQAIVMFFILTIGCLYSHHVIEWFSASAGFRNTSFRLLRQSEPREITATKRKKANPTNVLLRNVWLKVRAISQCED